MRIPISIFVLIALTPAFSIGATGARKLGMLHDTHEEIDLGQKLPAPTIEENL